MAADSVKFINYLHINENIGGYYIDPFELITNPHDRFIFKNLLKILFIPGNDIYILCSQLSNDNNSNDLKTVYDSIQVYGDMVEITDPHKTAVQLAARIQFHHEYSAKILSILWENYHQLSFFKPNVDLNWETFHSYGSNLFLPDADGKKMFSFDFMNFLVMKGQGGESLNINHKKTYALPDIKDIFHGKFKS